MCPPGPNAREPARGEKQARRGHPGGARPCLVNEGARGQTHRAWLGLAEGWPQSQALAGSLAGPSGAPGGADGRAVVGLTLGDLCPVLPAGSPSFVLVPL